MERSRSVRRSPSYQQGLGVGGRGDRLRTEWEDGIRAVFLASTESEARGEGINWGGGGRVLVGGARIGGDGQEESHKADTKMADILRLGWLLPLTGYRKRYAGLCRIYFFREFGWACLGPSIRLRGHKVPRRRSVHLADKDKTRIKLFDCIRKEDG